MAAGQSSDVDSLLKDIARDISDDEDIENLGKQLRFSLGEIKNFIRTNSRYHDITNYGTVSMLRKWSQRVSPSSLRSELREALMRARLVRIAETYLPSVEHYNTTEYEQIDVPANNAENITPAHIKILTRLVPPEKYTDLCYMLGVNYNQARQILDRFNKDYAQALSNVLHTWVDAKERSKADLKVALEGAELGGVYRSVDEGVRSTETNQGASQPATTGRKRAGKGLGTTIEQRGSPINITGNITNLNFSGQEANVNSSKMISQEATLPKTTSKRKGGAMEKDEESEETRLSNNLQSQQQLPNIVQIFVVVPFIAFFAYFLYTWQS